MRKEEVVPLLVLGLALLSRREEVRPTAPAPPKREEERPTVPAPPPPPRIEVPVPPTPPEVPRIPEKEKRPAVPPTAPPKSSVDIARQILEKASESVWKTNPEVAQRVQSAIDQVKARLEEELRRAPPKEYVPTPPVVPPRRVPEVLPVPVVGVREVE